MENSMIPVVSVLLGILLLLGVLTFVITLGVGTLSNRLKNIADAVREK
jgi:hypothetical protein